jgi:hypothetical protein
MGDVLSCIKDAGGAEGVENPIDAELLAQIGEILAQELLDFPETFSVRFFKANGYARVVR